VVNHVWHALSADGVLYPSAVQYNPVLSGPFYTPIPLFGSCNGVSGLVGVAACPKGTNPWENLTGWEMPDPGSDSLPLHWDAQGRNGGGREGLFLGDISSASVWQPLTEIILNKVKMFHLKGFPSWFRILIIFSCWWTALFSRPKARLVCVTHSVLPLVCWLYYHYVVLHLSRHCFWFCLFHLHSLRCYVVWWSYWTLDIGHTEVETGHTAL
jgi:hypothetical protein